MPTDNPTTTLATTEPPRALADGDSVLVDLAAYGLEAPETAPTTETPEPTAPEPDTAPARETRSEPRARAEAGKGKGNLGRALAEARGETRQARDEAKRQEENAERWRRVAEQAQRLPAEPGIKFDWQAAGLTAEEKRQLIQEAREATDFGAPVEKVITAFERLLVQSNQRAAAQASAQIERHFHQREYFQQERAFIRDGHEDFHEVVRRSGIADLVQVDPVTLQRGPKFNPGVTDEIAKAENQPEAIYGIAKNLLGESYKPRDLGLRSEPGTATDSPSPPAARVTEPPASSAEPGVRPTAAEVEAERRGAREVAARVADNGAQPQRSVRTFTPAGAPAQKVLNEDYRKYLDEQWDKNPFGVRSLFDAQPALRDWYHARQRGG